MPTKIRLQRKGKKGRPFYHLVVADGRAPRDGKFIEKLGTYDPMSTPATIDLNFDRSLYWVQMGAQPSDTVRSILSTKGIMLKHHLLKGVKKGALTEEQAEEKFQEWLKEKEAKLEKIISDSKLSEKEKQKKRIEEERKINEERAEVLAKRQAEEKLKEEAEKQQDKKEEPAKPEAEKQEEEPKAEGQKEETEKAEDKKEEAEKPADKKEETPEAEDKKEDTPKEESKKAEETKQQAKEEEPAKPDSEIKETPKAEEDKSEDNK